MRKGHVHVFSSNRPIPESAYVTTFVSNAKGLSSRMGKIGPVKSYFTNV